MAVNQQSNSLSLPELTRQLPISRSLVTGMILLVALIGFEMFNYSTTHVALKDLLGDLQFAGLSWAAILAIAFCGIDFAGIARLFMPEDDHSLQRDSWYLFGAWLLAATMNATLTWWGVSMSISNHALRSTTIVDPNILTNIVPVFVAIMVWVTRILLIGSFSFSGQRFFGAQPKIDIRSTRRPGARYMNTPSAVTRIDARPAVGNIPAARPVSSQRSNVQRVPSAAQSARTASSNRPEPEYVSDPAFTTAAQPAYHQLSGNQNNKAPRQF